MTSSVMTSNKQWTFFNNHAHALICLALSPDMVLREVALKVGVTERAVQIIVGDLESCGALIRNKQGRRNSYIINPDFPLRHELEKAHTIGELLEVLLPSQAFKELKKRWRIEREKRGLALTNGASIHD